MRLSCSRGLLEGFPIAAAPLAETQPAFSNTATTRYFVCPVNVLMAVSLGLVTRRKKEHVVVTHLDTHGAAWPFTGLRTHDEILAYETPNLR